MTIADNAKRDFPLLGDKWVFHRVVDLVRYAADASPYAAYTAGRYFAAQYCGHRQHIDYSRETGRHATFHAAGTSLNSPSQSDDCAGNDASAMATK